MFIKKMCCTSNLAKLAEQWLMKVEDGHIVAKVEQTIRPILIAGNYQRSGLPEKLFYGNKATLEKRLDVQRPAA